MNPTTFNKTFWIFIGILIGLVNIELIQTITAFDDVKSSAVNVAVIGSGLSGLCSAKNAIEHGLNVTVFEQNDQIGGMWHYTDKIGKDNYGINIHSAMYQELRTNVPYPVMEYPDFHYPNGTIPYPPHTDVLNYLNSYANHYDLKKHIKFSHLVIRVTPIENNKWEIITKNLLGNSFITEIYDFVFVCNGHFSSPFIPEIAGAADFEGNMIHSHDFRTAKAFQNSTVLMIGSGISARDIVEHLSKTANRITFSQHKRPNETEEAREQRQKQFPSKVTLQDNVKRITASGVEFIDGSHQTFDAIIYATGHNYTFPFLSVDSGIHVDQNHVQPLYKHIFNIEHPTMALFGITNGIASTHMVDIQVRFALKFLTGVKELPSKKEMLNDMNIQSEIHWSKGYRKHRTHFVAYVEKEYLKQLTDLSGIESIPDVLLEISLDSLRTSQKEPYDFRKYQYDIIDNKTFMKRKYVD